MKIKNNSISMVFIGPIKKDCIVIFSDGKEENWNLNELIESDYLEPDQKESVMNMWKTRTLEMTSKN